MSVYTYKARDLNGLLVVGQMSGNDPATVKQKLSDQGLIPIAVLEGTKRLTQEGLNLFNRVKQEELMLFTRQFHTLFKAGMDMETLLATLSAQTSNKFFSDSIQRIKTDIAGGASLARAFSQHPKIFSELYTNMLATGEEAGILDEVLAQVSTVLEKEITLKQSVKSATLYPKIVIFVLIGATIVLMTVVVPRFVDFFAAYGAELPLPTKILMAVSSFMANYWYIVAGTAAGLFIAYKKWVATKKGRFIMDRLQWKLPVFGNLAMKVANARFANILAALYKSGLPITRGLEITSKTIGNEAFSREIDAVRADVEKGKSIAESMRHGKYFSPLLVEATAIGEKSGALDDMYFSIGVHYDAEVSHTLKNLTTLIEPIMLFLIFGMVTVFALAIFMPMWKLSSITH